MAGNFVGDDTVFMLVGSAGGLSFAGEAGLGIARFWLTAVVVLGLAERLAVGSGDSVDTLSSVECFTLRPPIGSKLSVVFAVHVVGRHGR